MQETKALISAMTGGRMGVCVWGAPVGAGRQRQRPNAVSEVEEVEKMEGEAGEEGTLRVTSRR